MGPTLSHISTSLIGYSPPKILVAVLGLDGAGKTAIVKNLTKGGQNQTFKSSTIDSYNLQIGNQSYDVCDYTGAEKLRATWKSFCFRMHAVIFVIDATDRERLAEARQELFWLLGAEQLAGKPVLIFANKQELEGAMTGAEIVEAFRINDERHKTIWHIQDSSAVTGRGLLEGIEWLRQAPKS